MPLNKQAICLEFAIVYDESWMLIVLCLIFLINIQIQVIYNCKRFTRFKWIAKS